MRFLLCRLPGEGNFRYIKHKKEHKNIASFFPFDKGGSLHLLGQLLEIEEGQVSDILSQVIFPKSNEAIYSVGQEDYLKKVNQAAEEIKKHRWKKLVISRQIEISGQVNLEHTFLEICKQYPQAFCYLWKDEKQVWLGATPELLGKLDKKCSIFETMSLAGTLSKQDEWTAKEIEEQNAVTEYIYSVLSSISNNVRKSNTYEYILGSIKHLRTDFSARINSQNLQYLIEELHPTPAVCGIPKKACKKAISVIEGYDRSFYSGYIRVETLDRIYFFVNLRCMQIFENKAVIYVGGGITEKSDPMKEWNETMLKAGTLLNNIVMY